MPARRNKFRKPKLNPRVKPLLKSRARRPRAPGASIGASRGKGASARIAGDWFEKLLALQRRLRASGGCPWDREQTHETLRKFLIEETYEVLDAMESEDPRKFTSELGDLLLQIIFHSILAEESGRFTISQVIESVYTKMVRRHPHVFGNMKANTTAEVLKNWEQIKAEERSQERSPAHTSSASPESILSGVPRSLPAVLEAYQLTRRASHVGFDWDNLDGIFEKLNEETHELRSALAANPANVQASAKHRRGPFSRNVAARAPAHAASAANASAGAAHVEEEMGDLLFVAVNIARFLGIDPEIALKKANRKFKTRFTGMELAAAREGARFADLPRGRMEQLWDESKRFSKS